MSDPVTNVDIEDVLSSIRRLVTEGSGASQARPNADPVVAALRDAANSKPSAPDVAKPVGRFVLTPAFRVADVPGEKRVPQDDLALAARIMPEAEAKQALDGKAPTVGFDFTAPRPVAASAMPAAQKATPDDDAAPIDGRLRLSATVAGLEAAVTAQPDEWEPDGSEDVPVMDWSQAGPEDAPVFRSRNATPFRLEQAAKVAVGDAAPDEDDDPDGVTAFEQRVAADADLTAFLDKTGPFDEDMLRRLIVEIVHQELQGALGERITRNVRKLVRREISRMIASEEYE